MSRAWQQNTAGFPLDSAALKRNPYHREWRLGIPRAEGRTAEEGVSCLKTCSSQEKQKDHIKKDAEQAENIGIFLD